MDKQQQQQNNTQNSQQNNTQNSQQPKQQTQPENHHQQPFKSNQNSQHSQSKDDKNILSKDEQSAQKQQQLQRPSEVNNYKLQQQRKPQKLQKTAKQLDIQEQKIKATNTINEQEIQIQVVEEYTKGNALIKTYYYKILGVDKHGKFEIVRKYSELIALRNILRERWPGCFVPSINNENNLKNKKQHTQFKLRWLTHFFQCISKSKFIYYKEEIQLFLRSLPQMDIKQMYNQMPFLKVVDVVQRFKSCFGEQIQKQVQPANQKIISAFTTSLKKVCHNLSDLKKAILHLAQLYDSYASKMVKFAEVIQNYQQLALSQYTNHQRQRSVLIKDQQKNIQKMERLNSKNSFYEFYELLEIQLKDAEGFLQIILALQNFNDRKRDLEKQMKQTKLQIDELQLGHKSFKMIATRKTKQQMLKELQTKLQNQINQKSNITNLYNISEIILANYSISIFKQIKRKNYRSFLLNWSNSVKNTNPQLTEVWKFIQQENTNQLKLLATN